MNNKGGDPQGDDLMFQHNTNYINAINGLRASTGANPEHNQHIQ